MLSDRPLPVMVSFACVPLHTLRGLGSHRITLEALWATAAPDKATTSAAIAASTNNSVNLLLMRYSYLSVVRVRKVRKNAPALLCARVA
jgi:hypothetical protein